MKREWVVSGTIAHQCWKRLLGFGATRREAREYLEAAKRGTHAAFRGLELAKYPLGAVCTLDRFEAWRTSRTPAPAPAPAPAATERRRRSREEPKALSPTEVEEFVGLARLAMERSS